MAMLRFAIFALLAALAPRLATAQTDPALWRFVNPGSKAILSIDWKHIRQSHIGTMLREKWVDPRAETMPGVELLNDVDRVVISSPGRDPANDAAEPPALIVIRGHFDVQKVRKLLVSHGAKPQMFNEVQVYRPQDKNSRDQAFVPLDAQTILIGDARSVFTSLERNQFPPSTPEPIHIPARALELDALYDFWALMTAPGAMGSDRILEMFSGGPFGADARSFEIGLAFRDGLTIDSMISLLTEASAKQLVSELSKLLKTAIKDKMGEPAMLDLEKKLKISSEGSVVRIGMHLTAQEVDKNAKLYAATRKQMVGSVPDVRSPAGSTPASPKQPKTVIRIEGLDEGTREIPYKPNRPPIP